MVYYYIFGVHYTCISLNVSGLYYGIQSYKYTNIKVNYGNN